MKRLLAALLAVMLVCSMSFPAFAAEENKEQDVTVKYVSVIEDADWTEIQNGTATADGVTVTGTPANAKTLVVIPMEGAAWNWIDSCTDGKLKAAYDIHFLDAEGNRINANGVSVSIAAYGKNLSVSSVTTSGEEKNLSATVSQNRISFVTNGSHYYVVSKDNPSAVPQTGDRTMMFPWCITMVVAAYGFVTLLRKGTKKGENP